MMQNKFPHCRLGKVARVGAGHPIRGRVAYDPEGTHLLVQLKDVDPLTGLDKTSLVRFSPGGRKEPDPLRPSDILFVNRGNRFFGVLTEHDLPDALAAPYFFVIRTRTNQVLPEYLIWFINSSHAQRYFSQNAAGTAIRHVSRKVLDSLPVVLPPLTQQTLIVQAHGCWLKEKQLRDEISLKREQLVSAALRDVLAGKIISNTEQ